MSVFTEVKIQLDLIEVALYYGVQMNRGSFTNCLFHDDKTPSMKIYGDHFHCYGCGEHGDMITLVERLFSITPIQAAQKLAYDFGISTDGNLAAAVKTKPVIYSYIKQETLMFNILNEYCRFLERCRIEYEPRVRSDEFHPLFVESLQYYEQYNYYRDIFITGSEKERIEFITDFTADIPPNIQIFLNIRGLNYDN